jgi:hypothetical protein
MVAIGNTYVIYVFMYYSIATVNESYALALVTERLAAIVSKVHEAAIFTILLRHRSGGRTYNGVINANIVYVNGSGVEPGVWVPDVQPKVTAVPVSVWILKRGAPAPQCSPVL